MPWMETCRVEERIRFVQCVRRERWSVAAACRTFGISRKTGHKWLSRYEQGGLEALYDRSRARRTQAHAVSETIWRLVIEARRRLHEIVE